MATHTDNYTLGRGEIWFRRDGETDYRFLGNAPTFNLNVATTKLEHMSSRAGVGEKDMSITTGVNRTAALTLEDISHQNLALAFLGSTATLSQSSLTSQTYTKVIRKGGMIQVGETTTNPTGHRKLTSVVVKKGTDVLVLGTDYALDAERGLVEVLETGTTLADGDTIIVEYSASASSRKQTIAGATKINGAIKYIANNPQGDNVDYFLPQVVINPNGDVALITENALQNIQLQVDVLKRGTQAAVYADGQPYVAA